MSSSDSPLQIDGRFRISLPNSFLQHFHGRRGYENKERIGHGLFNGCRPLHIDFNKDIASMIQRLFYLTPRYTIKVAIDLGPFQQLLPLYHLIKRLTRDKVIIYTIAFPSPLRTGGNCHRKMKGMAPFLHPGQHRILTHARGA